MDVKRSSIILFLAITRVLGQHKITDQVFFDIEINDVHLGRVTIGLFGEVVPRTVENFKILATAGYQGKTYLGTKFILATQRILVQGGDILYNNGSGSVSIYGDVFEDENFVIKHTDSGYISMANSGPNSNGCQFFVTTAPAPWLDDHFVAFGKVLKGQHFINKIGRLKTDTSDKLLENVVIYNSGIIPTYEPFVVSDFNYSLLTWFEAGAVPLTFSFGILLFFHWAIRKLNAFERQCS